MTPVVPTPEPVKVAVRCNDCKRIVAYKIAKGSGRRPLREFCVSDFRQNQEYHVINVHDGGLIPLVNILPAGVAVCAPRAA